MSTTLTASPPDTIRQCARRRCLHRYRTADALWVPDDEDPGALIATCPECGHDVFTLPKPAREGGAEK